MVAGWTLLVLAVAAEAVPVQPPHNFLKKPDSVASCGKGANGEIVVCGRADADAQYRVRPLPDAAKYEPRHVKAETTVLGGARLGVHAEDAPLGGAVSHRAMVSIGVPF